MKKLITLLALCCLMVTGAWADPFQYSTSTESPQHVYNIAVGKSGEEAYLTSDGHGTRTTTEYARFAFFQDGSFFKIYCVDSKKWLYVATKPATTSQTVNNLIGVTSNEGDANLWKWQVDDKDASAWDVYTSLSVTGSYQGQDFGLCWCGGWSSSTAQTLGLNYGYHGSAAQARVLFYEAEMPTTQDYKVKYTLTDANGNVYTGNFTGATSDNPFSGVSGMTLTNVSYTDSSTPGYDKDLTATVSFPFTVSNGSDNNYVYISGFNINSHYWCSEGTDVKTIKDAVPARTDYEKYSWAIIPEFNGTDVTLKIKNVAANKYIHSTKTQNSHSQGDVTLTDECTAVQYDSNAFRFVTTRMYLSINSSSTADQYVGVYSSAHSGTKLSFTPVPFGNTEDYTVTITGATGATVTYGGTPYTSGQTITAENPTVSQLTASEVPGYYPSIAIGTNTINVTYNLLPFTTGKTYNLTLKGNGVYYDEATGYIKAGNVEDSENTSFIIGGTYADGYTLKSVGADEYLKHENVNNDNAKATTTANESEATRYEYAVKDGYHYFKIRGTDNNYVNYRDGYFSSWNNGSALGNDGSRLTFSEPIDPVKGYHIFQNGGTLHTTGSSAYCSQWTSSHANPQISINATDGNGAANDLEHNSTYANDGIVCYTGNNRDSQGYKITLTVAASFGYKITGFQFDASKADNSDYTIDVTAGGTTKTVSGTTVQHFSQTGVNAQEFVIVIKETAGSATHNKPILFNNFYVTYEAAEPLESEYKLVFDNANSEVPYRIPAVGQTKDGDLIFVTDYRYSHADIGAGTRLDLRYRKKYASDGHWGNVETLVHYIPDPFCAFGDPCIVCDRESNRVMVTSCCGNVSFPNGTYENHQGWARWYSNDGGETWETSFTDLAPQVVKQLDERQGDKMNAFFIGSGKISQSHIIKKDQYYRLYCASNTRMQSGKCNFVWYSDDFGATWNLLGSPDVKAINGGDEPKADELPDGSVVISSRDTGRIFNIFHYTDYENAEGYWGSQATSSSNNSGCYGTGCNGEILIVPVVKKSDNTKTYIALQSVPAASDRRNVSIYWKELTDFTKYRTASELAPNWTKFQVSGTTSAYSTMCQLQDGDIAFFYEENEYNGGYDMVYKKFSVEAITDEAYEYYNLNATEKAAYLTSCVGTYFNDQSAEVQALAQAYKADPTMKKYDALNAGFLSPDDLFFTPGLYQIQIGTGSGASHAKYNGYYMYAKGSSETWPIGLTTDATDETTYVYIWGSHDNWHMEFNHGKTDSYYAANNCKSATSAANLTFTPNDDQTEWMIWGGNQRWMGWENATDGSFVGSSSTANDNCYFIFTKVEEDIPTPALSLETESTVTSSQLSELSITFTGTNAAQVQLSETKNKAYLTPKTSTPAQVKAQNGKLKAAGETPAAIEGTVTKDANTDGKFNIAFEDEIPAGDYELSIPEGTFLVGTTPIPVLKANYTVAPSQEIPVNGKVYTIYNDHSGNAWYVSKTRTKNGRQDITSERVADGSQEWIAWGSETAGYTFYNLNDNSVILTANDGIQLFSIDSQNHTRGVTLCKKTDTNYHIAGNSYTGTLNGGKFSNPNSGHYNNEFVNGNDRWSTDFVFNFTGEYAYKVITTEGQTVTYNEKTYNKDAFVVSTDKLAANSVTASEITGKTASVSIDNDAMTITVTYEATTTPDGFHIYESNGTYSNVSSASPSFKDKWTSTQDAPRFEIFAHENGNSNGSNNMKSDATYANSGIVCYSGSKTNNISGMTVSIPTNGYVITGYSFKVKNYDTGDYSITVSAGESSVNTSSENKTISVSGLSVSSFEIIIDGSNGGLNKGVVLTDFYVTYAEGEHDVEVPATGYYYIKENGQYLYNDFLNHPEATQSIATKQTYDNGYVWKVTSIEGSTTVTLLNGEGSGYKANAGAEEETSIDLTGKNWTFEAFAGYDPIPVIVQYAILGDYVPFQEPWMTYETHNSVARNGGFFAFPIDEGERLERYGYSTNVIGQPSPDGTNWVGARLFNHSLNNHRAAAYYYSQQDVDRYADVVLKTYQVLFEHIGEPGYCTEQNEDFEDEGTFNMLNYLAWEVFMGMEFSGWTIEEAASLTMEPYEAKYYLGKLNDYIKSLTIAPPVMGDAYHIAVRGNDYTGNTKYYLKNDGTYTANEAEADVFVLGGSGDETCGSLLVTNNNPGTEGGIHYLQVRADGVAMNTEYKEADNALNLVSMTKAEGENIQSCPAYLYGTFSATNKNGKVLTFDETGDGSWISDAESLYMKDNKTSAIELIPVEYPYNKPNFTSGNPDEHEGGYASIWLPYPMVFPSNVEVYKGTVENEARDLLILTQVDEESVVAAGGYILRNKNPEETNCLVLPAHGAPEYLVTDDDQVFYGSTEDPVDENNKAKADDDGSMWTAFLAAHANDSEYGVTPYVLANKSKGIGFYKYVGTKLPKGKAIWFSPNDAPKSDCVKFTFGEVISAIEALHGNTDKAEIYDLQGHRLNKVEKGQVNVINGKKVMFK